MPFVDDDTLWTLLTVPDDFGYFINNVDFVRVALWFDGNESDIFAWANSFY
jgi:hypothetical protein